MRSLLLAVGGFLLIATTAHAGLNTYYEGTARQDGKNAPLSTRFSVERGRVAAIMSGARTSRMIFVEKEGVLRVIDDTSRSYFDLDRKSLAEFSGGAMAQMQKQMAGMPPEQRAMMEKMLPNATAASTPKPNTYVWSKDTSTVSGYVCTRVDVMRGDEKRAEYWGTTSPDFQMSDSERHVILAMNECLNGLAIMARGGPGAGAETRAFTWDTSNEGFPLISRCIDAGVVTLDVHLVRFDHKPLEDDLFKVPSGYAKQDLGGDNRGRHHGRP